MALTARTISGISWIKTINRIKDCDKINVNSTKCSIVVVVERLVTTEYNMPHFH